jgi:hypothetical protein
MAKGLSGTLSTMALPDLLQWAAAGRKTGTLHLQGEAFQVKLMFNGGAIVGSSSNDPREYLGQFLLSEGLITEQQLKDAFDLQARTRVMLGRILVKKGLLSEAKVSEVLQQKTEETIYSLFLWPDAEFEFRDHDPTPPDQVFFTLRVEDVLIEGLRRYDTSKKIRQVLPHNSLVLARLHEETPAEVAARAFPNRIYMLIDERRTLAQIILESHASEFNVLRLVHALVQRGYVRVAPEIAAAPAPGPGRAQAAGDPGTLGGLISAAKELLERGDGEGALMVLDKAATVGGRNPEVHALKQVAEEQFIERAYRHYLPAHKIPVLKKRLESLVGADLSPEEVFLVSRVNGTWDLKSIISISPLREVDALRAFKKLRERGVVDLVEPQARTA